MIKHINKRGIVILIILLFLLVINTSASVNDEINIKVSKEVLDKINENNEVKIIIKLKDPVLKEPSDEISTSSKTSKQELIKQQQDKVLSRFEKTKQKKVKELLIKTKDKEAKFLVKHKLKNSPIITATVNKEAIEQLKNDPDIEFIEYDKPVKAFLDNSIPIIHADDTWARMVNNVNITGAGQTVCVIDTGINYTHSNLGGVWGKKVIAGWKILDGCTVADQSCNCTNNNTACDDDNGHGTHCAGIIISNHSTYKGVAPDANVVVIRALKDKVGGPGGDAEGSMSDVIAGIDWCVSYKDTYNITVISMSLGTETLFTSATCPTTYDSSFDSAYDANITLVAASGNDGSTTSMGYPACNSKVISVGASDDNDNLWSATNRNPDLDILAPGVSIYSTYVTTPFTSLSGTSMACPHVAGAIALLRQDQYEKNKENLTVSEITNLIKTTNKTISTYPRLDVYWAIIPNITFVNPTPENNSYTNYDYIYVNVTTYRKVNSASLEINGTNYSMSSNSDKDNFYLNVTGLNGLHNYTVYVNDSSQTLFSSEKRYYRFNTAPEITWYSPLSLQPTVTENSSIVFNHTSRDNDSDSLSYYWYFNYSYQSTNTAVDKNITFSPNFTQSGVYNITLIVSDSYINTTMSWNLTIYNLNRLPNFTYLPLTNATITEEENQTFNITYTDLDGDTVYIYWYLNNSLRFTDYSRDNYTFYGNYTNSGIYNVTVVLNDTMNTTSHYWILNVTNVNLAPSFTLIENITVNVGLTTNNTVNITVNATDFDGDTLYYAINMSNFSQYNNVFLWNVTYFETGVYYVNITVNDSDLHSSQIIKISLGDLTDSDGDGIYDILDNDDDNDGILDINDNLKGNLSSITAFMSADGVSNSSSLNITILIDNSTNLTKQFDGEFNLTIKENSTTIIEAVTNMSEQNINFYNVTISKQNSTYPRGFLIIRGLTLSSTKTIYIDDVNASFNTICIKDADINNLSQISSGCNGVNETLVTCNSLGTVYNCSRVDNNTRYRITSLHYSAVHEQCADNDEDGYGTGCPLGSDYNDNNAAVHSAPTTTPSGNGGGDDSVTGGVGIATEPEEDATKIFVYPAFKKGIKKDITIDSEILPITKLSFKVINASKSVTLAIKSYRKQPSKVKIAAKDIIYKYMSIEATNLKKNIGKIKINFKVNKSYVKGNDLNISTIKLYYYYSKDKKWESVKITKKSEDFENYYYTSDLANFGYLATSLKKNVVPEIEEIIPEPVTTKPVNEIPSVNETKEIKVTLEEEKEEKRLLSPTVFIVLMSLIIILVIILVVIRLMKKG